MNFFELVFNFNSIIGITFLIILILLTIHSYTDTHDKQRKHKMLLWLVGEIVVFAIVLFSIRSMSSQTKSIIGAVDVVNWFF